MKFSKIAMITIAMVMLLSFGAYAQTGPIDKGSIMLGGGFQYTSASGDLYENFDGDGPTTMIFSPSFGYFFIPSLAFGIDMDLTSTSLGDYSMSDMGVGPTVMYFFDLKKDEKDSKGKIYPYVGAGFYYVTSTMDSGDPDSEEAKKSGTRIVAAGGATFMLSSAVGAYGELFYSADSEKHTDPIETDSESGSKLGFEVGVRAFIF